MAEGSPPGNGSKGQNNVYDESVDDYEEDEFEDANETVQIASKMDLHTAIEETMVVLNLFLNNHFTEARERMKPWAEKSPYHALGYGTLLYLQAAMTFEASDIEEATRVVKRSVHVCNKARKKVSMIGSLRGTSKSHYDKFTVEELHAELLYAECLIERALLTFIQDENLISFVKGSLKIRACYQSFKECQKMLDKRTWKDEDERVHFESGVCMGIGMFNLMISLLPSKILKLLEFVGFSGNKQKGLRELEKGAFLERSLRGPLCSMALMGYHTVVTYVLGTAEGDIDYAEKLLKPCLQNYPKGAMFLFFAGRIEEIRGNLDKALVKFEESVDSQSEWRQFHHLCFWELMWCHSFQGDWLLAMKYAERLCKESRWSRATYTYQKASFLMMCDDQTEETRAHILFLFSQVAKLKQRIAGKSIPIEKFAVKKAKRFTEQNNSLTLPAYELIYVWNGFTIIGKKPRLIEPILETVEKTINDILVKKDEMPYYTDDYCLALLLKGVCLRYKEQYFQAEQCFREIQSLEKKLKQDNYLVPYGLMELAMLHMKSGHMDEAKIILDKAKNNYKGYSLESRLHFRIHAANLQLKALTNPEALADETTADNSPPSTPATLSKQSIEAPYMDDEETEQLSNQMEEGLNLTNEEAEDSSKTANGNVELQDSPEIQTDHL